MAANFKITREFIDQLKDAVGHNDEVTVFNLVKDLHAADIAGLYGGLTIDEAKFVYFLLDGEKAADVIIELEEDERERFLDALPGEVIARQFIDNMDSDDAADVLGELSDERKEEVLQNIEDLEQAGDLIDLLNYDEDTAGGLMATELIKVNEEWDIETCIREIRIQAAEVDEVYYAYVVDDKNFLKGTVSLKRIIVARPNAKIKNLLNPDVKYVRTNATSEEVANVMEKYDLVALPVVDQVGRLLGRITIDDIVDVIREEAEKDYQMMSGISEDIESSDNIFLHTRARLPWLLVGMLGGIMSANIISIFEPEIKIDPKMAMFIPLIAAMGGNVGVQSSAIVVQGLASKSINLDSTGKKIFKEFSVGIINATIFSSLILIYNIVFSTNFSLTITVSIALFTVILFASVFGTFIPMFLKKINIDPAMATGPFISSTNDIVGLFVYLGVGRILYGVFG